MHRKIAIRRIGAVLLPLALVALAGCPPREKKSAGAPPEPPPRLTLDEAVAAVNNNVAGITQSLASGNIRVNATFHDEEGKAHDYRDLRGVLRFFPPHYLYLRIGDIVEPSAVQLGSNADIFWMAIKPKRNELWWGRWADLGPAATVDLPLAPDMVLAAMGLARLPTASEGLRGPVPRVDDDGQYKLLYMASSSGTLRIQREYWLDPFPPHLPRAVIFREPDGTIEMIATLGRHERVGESSVYIAREIRMSWPETKDSLSMRTNSLKFDPRFGPGSRAYDIEGLTTIPKSRWVRVGNERRTAPPTTAPAATDTDETPAQPTESSTTMPAPATEPAAEESPAAPEAVGPTDTEPQASELTATEPAQPAAPTELESSPE